MLALYAINHRHEESAGYIVTPIETPIDPLEVEPVDPFEPFEPFDPPCFPDDDFPDLAESVVGGSSTSTSPDVASSPPLSDPRDFFGGGPPAAVPIVRNTTSC